MLRAAVVVLFAFGSLALLRGCGASCPNHCSGHGDCSTPDLRCSCHTSVTQQDVSYAGADCSLRECPKGVAWADDATATDVAHAAGTMKG